MAALGGDALEGLQNVSHECCKITRRDAEVYLAEASTTEAGATPEDKGQVCPWRSSTPPATRLGVSYLTVVYASSTVALHAHPTCLVQQLDTPCASHSTFSVQEESLAVVQRAEES